MGEFDNRVFTQRQRMITACYAHQDQTLQLLVSVEKAAREGNPCPEVPKKFRGLSLRLSTAVDKITKKTELGVKIGVLRKEQQEKGKTIAGLLMYHMLLRQYKFSANSASYYDMRRIQSLCCNGDKDLQRFLADWDTTRMRMSEQPSEYMLTRLFWEQVRTCRDFGFIFEQYENADEGTYKKTYKWLRDQINKTVERRKVESNMRHDLRHFRDSQPRSQNAMHFRSRSPSGNCSNSPRSKGVDRRGQYMDATVTGRNRQGYTYKYDRPSSRDRRTPSPRRDDRRRTPSPRASSRGRNSPRRSPDRGIDPSEKSISESRKITEESERNSEKAHQLQSQTWKADQPHRLRRLTLGKPGGKEVCRYFPQGKCTRGDSCKYLDVKPEGQDAKKTEYRNKTPPRRKPSPAAPVEAIEEVEPSEVCTTSYWSDDGSSDIEPIMANKRKAPAVANRAPCCLQ
eukprot:2420193-Amphidinium_carterae.2